MAEGAALRGSSLHWAGKHCLCCSWQMHGLPALRSPAAALPMHLAHRRVLHAAARPPAWLPCPPTRAAAPAHPPCRCSGGRARGGVWWCRQRTIPPNTGTDQFSGTAPSDAGRRLCPCGPPANFLVLPFVCCSNQVLCHQQRWLLGLSAVNCHPLTPGASCIILCAQHPL